MLKLIKKSNWLTGSLIFLTPLLGIFFLGSQMAYSQVKGKFEAYQDIPEITRLAALAALEPGAIVMVRGKISGTPPPDRNPAAADLIVYQERPRDGREVRYREEFPLIFPPFSLALPDGVLTIAPSLTREPVIRHELHTVSQGDRQYTGFRSGDAVTVQGARQAQAGEAAPTLADVTGVAGVDKAGLVAEWQGALRQVGWARNGLGLLTLLGVALLVRRLRRTKNNQPVEARRQRNGRP